MCHGPNCRPWWYHRNRNFYDADRCPPNYYFDNNCKCCRYYLNNPEYGRAQKSEENMSVHRATDSSATHPNVIVRTTDNRSIYIPLAHPSPVFQPLLTGAPSGASAAVSTSKSDTLHISPVDSATVKKAADSSPAMPQAAAPDTSHAQPQVTPRPLRRSIRSR